MSVAEAKTMDMSSILMGAYQVGDLINNSAEVADYLYWKQAVEQDFEAQRLVREFNKAKDLFEECERFGHFHPDYHAALDKVQAVQSRLEQVQSIKEFKEAEERLDQLLYTISKTIATAVSDTIKVPGGLDTGSGGGCSSCGSGGSCSSCG
ncbi:YlbF family regulator [Paenibacillus sp. 1P03SA]|uniref:YlbF family regulator n=1 Tax=Paenibacillus sp. 1P03SA TaxID=3132294 RepID=UPI00399F707E